MLLQLRLNELRDMGLEARVRSLLVLPHQARVAGYVRREDGSEMEGRRHLGVGRDLPEITDAPSWCIGNCRCTESHGLQARRAALRVPTGAANAESHAVVQRRRNQRGGDQAREVGRAPTLWSR